MSPLLLLFLPPSLCFFIPGPSCSCGCPTLMQCPPAPTCAVALPCETTYTTPEQTLTTNAQLVYPSDYQPGYLPAITASPVSYAVAPSPSSYVPSPSYLPSSSYLPSPSYSSYIPSYATSAVPQPSIFPSPPVDEDDKIYQTVAPPPFSLQSSQYTSLPSGPAPSIPSDAYLEDGVAEVQKSSSYLPTLAPPPSETEYRDQSVAAAIPVYDDTAPAMPPPAPRAPSNYRTTSDQREVLAATYRSTENLRGPTPIPPTALYDHFPGIHMGDTGPILPMGYRKSYEDPLPYRKRNAFLKRMRNAQTMIPRTNATCNSHKLANIMARSIVEDVSVSKRMVMRATEMEFDGARFDVFCATGEFSYSIHSRKYCEVTRDLVTCFAFR